MQSQGKQKFDNSLRWGEVNSLFNVTFNDISTTNVMAQRCTGGLGFFKVIPGEAGFRTDCFKIWVYNMKDIILLTSIVVSCPSGICLLSI